MHDAIRPRNLAYVPGERSVKAYMHWLNGFDSDREALTEARKQDLAIGNSFMSELLTKAYQELANATDPAVRYFTEILTVLPKQQRDAVPCVEWVGTTPYQMGIVSTPGGDELGDIRRRPDGLWNITPSVDGPVSITAIAESQTDARCYLADLLTRPARLIIEDDERDLRIVGEELGIFETGYYLDSNQWGATSGNEQRISQITFWDDTHSIKIDDVVRLEVQSSKYPRTMDVLEGAVRDVKEHKVFIDGTPYCDSAC